VSFLEHFVSIFDLILKFIDQAHIDHGIRVLRILGQRFLAVSKGLIKVLRIVLIDSHAIVSKPNITEVFEGLGLVNLRSLLVMEDTLVKLLHDKSHAGYELMHSRIFLIFLDSHFQQLHGFSKVRSST
jgi:hypothetical protein